MHQDCGLHCDVQQTAGDLQEDDLLEELVKLKIVVDVVKMNVVRGDRLEIQV